jgi:hypothetical protein
MDFAFKERPSDSPLIDRVWRTHSERPGTFTSVAGSQSELVVMKHQGKLMLTVRGPETTATSAFCPPDGEWVGIVFKLGTYMPLFPPGMVMDRHDLNLPGASSKSFWLDGAAWEFPGFDNADTFVDRLVRQGLLAHDDLVNGVLQGRPHDLSIRTVRRRFLRATGLTHGAIVQIERARRALLLLQQGVSILDTVYEAGFYDQPHLTRALKRLVGWTPAQIAYPNEPQPMSLSYKTEHPDPAMMQMF